MSLNGLVMSQMARPMAMRSPYNSDQRRARRSDGIRRNRGHVARGRSKHASQRVDGGTEGSQCDHVEFTDSCEGGSPFLVFQNRWVNPMKIDASNICMLLASQSESLYCTLSFRFLSICLRSFSSQCKSCLDAAVVPREIAVPRVCKFLTS